MNLHTLSLFSLIANATAVFVYLWIGILLVKILKALRHRNRILDYAIDAHAEIIAAAAKTAATFDLKKEKNP